MTLDAYRRKRRPGRTPEPFAAGRAGGDPVFVVQRHAARRLHYDLRLERDGVLASWAVPKGVPLARGERHLAVRVEDHPLGYASFEGRIPAGEYGAGTVEIWDRGTYELLERKRDGGLTVRLRGRRLAGVWTLVPAALDGKDENWLLIRKDEGLERHAYQPMLATLATEPPHGRDWSFEPKWDGYRAIVTVAGGTATLSSRRGGDLTERFPAVARAAEAAVRVTDAVLDGEVVALDTRGAPSFSLLQRGEGHAALVLFDVLEEEGEVLVDLPLADRRERLARIVDATGDRVLVSPAFEDGDALLAAAEEQGLEGIVAKRLDGRYEPGRRVHHWRKVKTTKRQEFVVVGWTSGRGRRSGGVGALVLAVVDRGELRWVGNVGTGFTDAELARLHARFRPIERRTSPLATTPRMPRTRRGDVHWVEPSLVAEVEFAEWTAQGRLRAPVYLGLRDDKAVAEVHQERAPIGRVARHGRRSVALSNLEKVFWPAEGITKRDLLTYYRDVAPVLVPHLRRRPFTMKRYPDGWQGRHFFQKNVPSRAPTWLHTAPLPATTREGETRTISYALVDDLLALLWVVNLGCIDLHTWTSRADLPHRPDWVVFDLDPADGTGFEAVCEVALLVREALVLLGLEGFPKTSGAKGMHVLVPLARRHTHDDARRFASIVAAALARAHPGLVTTEWARRKRRGVLIDVHQNGAGRTTASAYSVRPRAGAPVSTPLRWDEVRPGLEPGAFTMDVALERVARHGDLAAGVLTQRQTLTAALRELS